jgi:acetyl esterase/lipase
LVRNRRTEAADFVNRLEPAIPRGDRSPTPAWLSALRQLPSLLEDVMTDANPHPPIDPELLEMVWPIVVESVPVLTLDAINAIRAMTQVNEEVNTALHAVDLTRGGTVEVQDQTIEVAPGGPHLPAVILRPAGRTEALPCLYYTSNGGKIVQDPLIAITDVDLQWVAELGIALVSISPRPGPEHPHPAQVEDGYAGLIWITKNADKLRVDRDNIMVMGKSGGGGIAAATALMARDRGGPALTHQILITPMMDDREVTFSSRFENPPWPRASNRVGWAAILGDARGGPSVNPYAAPARATELRGLPPTYIEVGGTEVFRDEGIDYAARLGQAGVRRNCTSGWVGSTVLTCLHPTLRSRERPRRRVAVISAAQCGPRRLLPRSRDGDRQASNRTSGAGSESDESSHGVLAGRKRPSTRAEAEPRAYIQPCGPVRALGSTTAEAAVVSMLSYRRVASIWS